jgi:3'-5' exonuclease
MTDFLEALSNVLFLDIETASEVEQWEELPDRLKEEWLRKEQLISNKENNQVEPGSLFFSKAGIYAEFGKVICIGVGYFHYVKEEDRIVLRTKSYCEAGEKETLEAFSVLLNQKKWHLCAHNGREFDFPYLCRRLLINKLPLPEPLQISGKKPWEIRHIDTMELWKFGDFKHYTRLELLAALFDIPTSKEGIDGSEVNEFYYHKKDIKAIRHYCLRDVVVTARIYLALISIFPEKEIIEVNTDPQSTLSENSDPENISVNEKSKKGDIPEKT